MLWIVHGELCRVGLSLGAATMVVELTALALDEVLPVLEEGVAHIREKQLDEGILTDILLTYHLLGLAGLLTDVALDLSNVVLLLQCLQVLPK